MLTLFGRTGQAHCDGVSRRDFLRIGTLGFAGLGLADLLRARANAASAARDTSVILLWLGGGPSQHETFDPKPDTPEEYRSLVGTVATTLPGVRLGGLFPNIAKLMDRMALVRSLAHRDPSHEGATHWLQTGHSWPMELISSNPKPQPQFRPAIGSIIAGVRGAIHPVTSVPAYFVVDRGDYRHLNDGPAWLGQQYGPMRLEKQNALNNNVTLRLPIERLHDRRRFLASIDGLKRAIDDRGAIQGMDEFQQQAFRILTGSIKEVLDLNREDVKTREKYGPGLGEKLLLARRVCEAGAGFVTVNHEGWDHHGVSGAGPLREGLQKMCPPLDHAVAAFLEDVRQRGLDKNILLIITGEFGRTPKIDRGTNNITARHHWNELCPLAVAGGGLRMGQVVGESTAKAERPKSTPFLPEDLMATIFHVLGIDPTIQFKDHSGRPISMIEKGKPIEALL
jgi:hypothetical protein